MARIFPSGSSKQAFFYPDAAIQKSSLNPPDGEFIKARRVYIVPNGCSDQLDDSANQSLSISRQ